MAHNADDDFGKYYRKPIGQLLLLDENIVEYVKLTNPLGSGGGGAIEAPKRKVTSINDLKTGAFGRNLSNNKEIFARKTTREDLPPHLKYFVAVDEEERRAGN